MPYDIGCISSNINGKTDLTSLTADQWKNFALIYARPCLSGLLSTNAYKSVCLLCEIVELITKPIYYTEDITTLYRKLNDHHKMYASVYGKWEVSVNYHFALHIPDPISDYGPPQVYWCFAYERMNGILCEVQITVKILTPDNKQNHTAVLD